MTGLIQASKVPRYLQASKVPSHYRHATAHTLTRVDEALPPSRGAQRPPHSQDGATTTQALAPRSVSLRGSGALFSRPHARSTARKRLSPNTPGGTPLARASGLVRASEASSTVCPFDTYFRGRTARGDFSADRLTQGLLEKVRCRIERML